MAFRLFLTDLFSIFSDQPKLERPSACQQSPMIYLLREPNRLDDAFWQKALPYLDGTRQKTVLRYRMPRDRNLSVAAYLLLWLGLREDFGLEKAPVFVTGQRGKPFLEDGWPEFSLSHCPQAVVCALDTEAVGVDVESCSAMEHALLEDCLPSFVYAPEERHAVQTAPDSARTACALWTAKESICKYTGQGLDDDLPWLLCRTKPHVCLHGPFLEELSMQLGDTASRISVSSTQDSPCYLRVDGLSFTEPDLELALCRRQRPGLKAPRYHEVCPSELEALLH